MSLGSQTQVIDGQRNIFPTAAQYTPASYGPQTVGVPQVSPTMPPFMGGQASGGANAGMEGVGGYGTAGNNAMVAAVAAGNPHNIKVSPVWWAVIFLVGGLLLLQGVHWRTLEAGFEESGRVGRAKESASAEA